MEMGSMDIMDLMVDARAADELGVMTPEKEQRMFVITRKIKGFPAHLMKLNHWALVIGDTLWELDSNKDGLPFPVPNLKSQTVFLNCRPVSEEELKEGAVLEAFDGWTSCSAEQIKHLADGMIRDWGAYNCFSANCQHFAMKLYHRIGSVR